MERRGDNDMLQNKDEHAIKMYLYQYYETLYEFNDSTSSPPT